METAATDNSSPAASPHSNAIALWNPNAAALWSIIFTPLFGAYIHALNWRALGDDERERASMTWVVGAAAFLLLFLLIEVVVPNSRAGDEASRTIEFVFLVVWYFVAARGQVKVIQARYGNDYARQSWKKPLLMGLAGFGIYIALVVAIGIAIGLRNL